MKDYKPANILKRWKADHVDHFNILEKMAIPCVISYFIAMFILVLASIDAEKYRTVCLIVGGITFLIIFFIAIGLRFYYFGYHQSKYGKTPGEKKYGITTIDSESGSKPSFKQAGLRSIMPTSFILEFFNKDKKDLNDYISSTRVIEDSEKNKS